MDKQETRSRENTLRLLDRWESYNDQGLFGFQLPRPMYVVLKRMAQVRGCTCSELVRNLVEACCAQELCRVLEEDEQRYCDTNLISSLQYAENHHCSQEQIKQYLQQGSRMAGLKVARNWIIPEDAEFPRRRQRGRKGRG